MSPSTASLSKKHLATCSIVGCKQQISENCSLHVFPNERDPRRKQWIKVLKVERDVPRHFRICSKHFKASDFFPRHQMQKKLMLRPTAVPSEHLPNESISYVERSDSPDNTSSSFVSLDHQSDSSAHGNMSTPQVVTPNGNSMSSSNISLASSTNHNSQQLLMGHSNNNIINNNNNPTVINNNGNHLHHHSEYQEDVKIAENFTYHQNSTPSIVQATNIVTYQPSSYETTLLTPLSTVPYQEITEQPMYMTSDGNFEIDQYRLASVLNKDDYGDGTITYVVNFVDY